MLLSKKIMFTDALRAVETYGVDVVREESIAALDELLSEAKKHDGSLGLDLRCEVGA
jgi:hypothetical protein